MRLCSTFFFLLPPHIPASKSLSVHVILHNQTYARFLCRASAFDHLIKLSPFLASDWIKELFGRQRLIDLHHGWRQHSRCFNYLPALVLWMWMRTYQELCCSCHVVTCELTDDDCDGRCTVMSLSNLWGDNTKRSPLIDPLSSNVMTHFLKYDFCGEISHQSSPHFNCLLKKFKIVAGGVRRTEKLKIAFSECQMDVDRREVGPTGNNQVKLTEKQA